MRSVATTGWYFLREQMRSPLVLVLLIVLPALFVVSASSVLSDFSRALGGSARGDAATALAAGWSVAFLAGALGFFVTMSSHEADQRLALAGLGPGRTAAARLTSALGLAVTVAAAAFMALRLRQPVPHAAHTMLAMLAYACVYLAIGTAVGSLVRDALAGSLLVVFVFLLDVFSGPGMSAGTSGLATVLSPSQKAGELLLAAGAGRASAGPTWSGAALSVAAALCVAFAAFWFAARSRR